VASPGFGARGAQVEAPKAPRGWGCAPSAEKFLNFYINMVSSGALWVAISYRLAACFTGIGSTCGVEIYWRSFWHFGNYNYCLRKTVGKK